MVEKNRINGFVVLYKGQIDPAQAAIQPDFTAGMML